MNLAPIRYARILTGGSGPVERIEYGRLEVLGRPMFQATAQLSGHLNLRRAGTRIFGEADGTGTHWSGMVARHKAVSEALERWAYQYMDQSGQAPLYGGEHDPTTSGMAAYPGLFKGSARRLAMREAIERHCLADWWYGKLGSTMLRTRVEGTEGIAIENPLSRDRVVVVWRQAEQGFYGYGFACRRRTRDAIWDAVVEMERSIAALKGFYRKNPGIEAEDMDVLENYMERRMFYYSLPEGHREFRERIGSGTDGGEKRGPVPVFDRELKGPWGKYATVWRVIFPTARRDHLIPQRMVFFW